MKDMLQISALQIQTYIGVHAWEQRILQKLLIDIDIPLDFSDCHDQITNTIDYDQLCQRITHYLESNTFTLIETVAEKTASLIKEEFHVEQFTVRVSKPHAVKNAGNICVTVNR